MHTYRYHKQARGPRLTAMVDAGDEVALCACVVDEREREVNLVSPTQPPPNDLERSIPYPCLRLWVYYVLTVDWCAPWAA